MHGFSITTSSFYLRVANLIRFFHLEPFQGIEKSFKISMGTSKQRFYICWTSEVSECKYIRSASFLTRDQVFFSCRNLTVHTLCSACELLLVLFVYACESYAHFLSRFVDINMKNIMRKETTKNRVQGAFLWPKRQQKATSTEN